MTDRHSAFVDEMSASRTDSAPLEPSQVVSTKNESAGNGKSDPPPRNAIWHGQCGQWWTGAERSHASCCHRTFSSLTTFDRHRKGGRCNDPADVGLVPRDKPYGVLWALPAPEGGYSALFGRTGEEPTP